jgi:hypothetical protein
MDPSKALNIIASGTKSREGMNDLGWHDQISDASNSRCCTLTVKNWIDAKENPFSWGT